MLVTYFLLDLITDLRISIQYKNRNYQLRVGRSLSPWWWYYIGETMVANFDINIVCQEIFHLFTFQISSNLLPTDVSLPICKKMFSDFIHHKVFLPARLQ